MSLSTSSSAPRYDAAMARFSQRSIFTLQRLLRGQKAPTNKSGAAKRKFAQEMEPAARCYHLIKAPNVELELENIQFAVLQIGELLRYVVHTVPSFAHFLRDECSGKIIISHDETTAGNVLNTDASQKAVLFYMTFYELQYMHESPRAITHRQVNQVNGGLSKIHALFLEEWHRQTQQPLTVLPDVRLTLKIHCMVSDLDAQRLALCAKGSAGLKPCAFCQNVVSRSAETTALSSDDSFVTIHEHDLRKCQRHSQAQLEDYMTRALRAWPSTTKAEKELRERCLGYNIGAGGMWESNVAKEILPLHRFVNDSMHCYFCNGCCSAEILLLLAEAKKHTGIEISAIQQVVLDTQWLRAGHQHRGGENKHWTKRLFTESFFYGNLYKGSAKQTVALTMLLRWIAETLWLSVPELAPYARCFLLLCRCVDCIRRITQLKNYEMLSQVQSEHQQLFASLYHDSTRPKHHARLHLSEQYSRLDCEPNCWGTESKHRDYKGVFAPTVCQFITQHLGGGEFSKNLLPRLLMRHCELLRERPITKEKFELRNAFTREQVQAETGLERCQVSGHCRVGMLDLEENDILLSGSDLSTADKIHFFVERNNILFLYVTQGLLTKKTESLRTFQLRGSQTMKLWSELQAPTIPSWIKDCPEDFVHCLI